MAMLRDNGTGGVVNAPSPMRVPEARFEEARKSTMQRDAQSVGAMDSIALSGVVVTSQSGAPGAQAQPGIRTRAAAASADKIRRAGNHLFARSDNRWTDVAYKEGMSVVKIKAFTPAYFAVLDAIPELRASFAVGEKVLVTGKHVAIEVSDDGVEQLGDAELRSLKEQW